MFFLDTYELPYHLDRAFSQTIRPNLRTHADLESSLALRVCCTSERRSQDFSQTRKYTGVIPDATVLLKMCDHMLLSGKLKIE